MRVKEGTGQYIKYGKVWESVEKYGRVQKSMEEICQSSINFHLDDWLTGNFTNRHGSVHDEPGPSETLPTAWSLRDVQGMSTS